MGPPAGCAAASGADSQPQTSSRQLQDAAFQSLSPIVQRTPLSRLFLAACSSVGSQLPPSLCLYFTLFQRRYFPQFARLEWQATHHRWTLWMSGIVGVQPTVILSGALVVTVVAVQRTLHRIPGAISSVYAVGVPAYYTLSTLEAATNLEANDHEARVEVSKGLRHWTTYWFLYALSLQIDRVLWYLGPSETALLTANGVVRNTPRQGSRILSAGNLYRIGKCLVFRWAQSRSGVVASHAFLMYLLVLRPLLIKVTEFPALAPYMPKMKDSDTVGKSLAHEIESASERERQTTRNSGFGIFGNDEPASQQSASSPDLFLD